MGAPRVSGQSSAHHARWGSSRCPRMEPENVMGGGYPWSHQRGHGPLWSARTTVGGATTSSGSKRKQGATARGRSPRTLLAVARKTESQSVRTSSLRPNGRHHVFMGTRQSPCRQSQEFPEIKVARHRYSALPVPDREQQGCVSNYPSESPGSKVKRKKAQIKRPV